ncbi:MAG: Spy0128 family protein, partial [Coriobacteriales bacterium]
DADKLTASFGEVEFDAVGTYRYEIAEVVPADAGRVAGIVYDEDAHPVVVTVSAGEDNELVATADYDGADALVIMNHYAEATATLQVTKAFDAWDKADGFDFELTPVDGAPMPAGTTGAAVATATVDEPSVSFDPIIYREVGTFEYTIAERDGGVPGVTYDTDAHKAVVNVTRNADGDLDAQVVYDDGAESLVVTNTYTEPEPQVTSIAVTKSWDDGDDADGIRPATVTIHLLANGEDTGETLELTVDEGWTGSFADLPVADESGEAIAYTVSEDPVPGYDEPVIAGDAESGFMVTNPREPQSPDEPDTPPDGDEPTPDKGTTPGDEPNSAPPSGTASATTVKGALAKTADEAPLAPLVLLLAAGAACAVAAAARRRSR